MRLFERQCRLEVTIVTGIFCFLVGRYFSAGYGQLKNTGGLPIPSSEHTYIEGLAMTKAELNVNDCPDLVKERLLEANEIWQQGVAARKELESTNPIDAKDPWSFKKGTSFYDFFYPTFDCPYNVERVGRSGDGGKWVCGFRQVARSSMVKPCVVYSYGISREISFEEEILQRTNCSVYMFDHTIKVENIKLPKKYPGRAFIEKLGMGVDDTNKNLRSLKSKMYENGHEFLEILKVDVEGAELDILNSFAKEFPSGLPFGQLEIELHLKNTPRKDFYNVYSSWMNNIESMGLRAFRNELNFLGWKGNPTHNPIFVEYSFINVNVNHTILHS